MSKVSADSIRCGERYADRREHRRVDICVSADSIRCGERYYQSGVGEADREYVSADSIRCGERYSSPCNPFDPAGLGPGTRGRLFGDPTHGATSHTGAAEAAVGRRFRPREHPGPPPQHRRARILRCQRATSE